MLSFNSYGEWTKVNEDIDDDSYYIDFATVKEIDGYVVWWEMKDFVKPNDDGFLSSQKYYKGDCESSGVTYLSWYDYEANMSEGNGEDRSMGILKLEDIMGWIYPPPDSVAYDNLQIVCSLVDQSSMSNYDNKVSELILEYESIDWGEDTSYDSSSSDWVPPNAQIVGNTWYCDEGYERYNNGCIPSNQERLDTLTQAYVSNIAARVKSFWRYQGAEDDWTAEVYIVQDRDGTVVAVDVRNTNVGDSPKAKSFKNSIERAVYKASPLPSAPDKSVFDRELMITFSVN
jgi:hypothetical protein